MSKFYSFCESVTATSISPLCIRVAEGKTFPGGGVDSNSLCGRVKAPMGWDIEIVPVDLDHPRACRFCVAIARSPGDHTEDGTDGGGT